VDSDKPIVIVVTELVWNIFYSSSCSSLLFAPVFRMFWSNNDFEREEAQEQHSRVIICNLQENIVLKETLCWSQV